MSEEGQMEGIQEKVLPEWHYPHVISLNIIFVISLLMVILNIIAIFIDISKDIIYGINIGCFILIILIQGFVTGNASSIILREKYNISRKELNELWSWF